MPRTKIVSDSGDAPEDACAESTQASANERSGSGVAQPPVGCTEAEHYAWHLRESAASMLLHAAMSPTLKGIDWEAYKLYRDRLLADSGSPNDPVEVMILEQLGLAHFCMALLAAKTTNASHVNSCSAYASASARLMAEFRRSALALQGYRHANRQLARDPARDVTGSIAGSGPSGDLVGENRADTELIASTEASDGDEGIIPYARPEAV